VDLPCSSATRGVLPRSLSCVAAGFSDSVVRVYNLEQMGNARSKLPKYHKHQLQSAKRQRGAAGELEPGIDVDTEMAELQVRRLNSNWLALTPIEPGWYCCTALACFCAGGWDAAPVTCAVLGSCVILRTAPHRFRNCTNYQQRQIVP
jgi:hypothetical protein